MNPFLTNLKNKFIDMAKNVTKKSDAKKTANEQKSQTAHKIKETKVIVEFVNEQVAATGILPIEEAPKKEETKKSSPDKKGKTKEDSSPFGKEYEIMAGRVKFLGGDIELGKGCKIQRVSETQFKIDDFAPDGKSRISEVYEIGLSSGLLASELEMYNRGLGNPASKNAEGEIIQLSNEVQSPVVHYATNSPEAMRDYANGILAAIKSTPTVKYHNKTIPSTQVENMFKSESKSYSYELCRNSNNECWINMTGGGQTIRIPENKTEFLPVH